MLQNHDCLLCRYEFQCQYGSIGWSVGATLGSALALKGQKRVIACIGDGSFQVTATVSAARSQHPCLLASTVLWSRPSQAFLPTEQSSSLWHDCRQPAWCWRGTCRLCCHVGGPAHLLLHVQDNDVLACTLELSSHVLPDSSHLS